MNQSYEVAIKSVRHFLMTTFCQLSQQILTNDDK